MEQPFDNPLTLSDFNSQTWRNLEIFLNDKLNRARERNDHLMSGEARGAVIGEIACYKTLLRLRTDALQDKTVFDQLYESTGSPLAGRPVTPQTATPVRRSV